MMRNKRLVIVLIAAVVAVCSLCAVQPTFADSADSIVIVGWGRNDDGQAESPDDSDDYKAISAGVYHSLALKFDGSVVGWGWKFSDPVPPLPLLVGTGFDAIAAGGHHGLGLKPGGLVWAWGYNGFGQLGDGTTTDQDIPVQVSGLTEVVAIAAGAYHSLGLKGDDTVWAWGKNADGQLGDGSTTNRHSPVQVSGLTDVVAIAAGDYHSLGLKSSNGTVWAWGNNADGQLGDGTTTDQDIPVQVSDLTDVVAIAGGWGHSLALKSNGSVWAWGYNGSGQLGDNTTTDRHSPVQVSGLTDVMAIAAGGHHSLAIKSDGSVWAWGNNYPDGQLGDGTNYNRKIPVQVVDPPGDPTATEYLSNIVAIAAGGHHSLALEDITSARPPVAVCQDVTVEAGPGCEADADIDGGSYDPDGDPITTDQTPAGPYSLGTTEVTLTVTDDSGASDTCTATVTVEDTTSPVIVVAVVEPQLVEVLGTVTFDGVVGDECNPTVEWDFGDEETSAEIDTSHDYAAPDIHTVTLTVTDSSGNASTEEFIVVVYDPSGGFVTGGGWIYSEAGYLVADPDAEGKANFGFVSKYKKGATEPTGQTEFVFKAGDLNFHSSSYEWLVVTGSDYARFKGWGSINGNGNYRFMLWAGDDAPDTFRIKIWWEDGEIENVVYDNGMDQQIGGGSIVIHTKK